MFAIIATVLIGIAQSATFEANSLSSSGLTFSIDVGETTTSITVTAPRDKWSAIGFGSSVMDGTVVAVFAGTTSGIVQRKLGDGAPGTELGSVYWTVDSITVNTTESLTYVMSRNNDISETCADCYVFDSSATSLQVIYAIGSSTTFGIHTAKRAQTLTASTPSPTPSPIAYEDYDYTECVSSDNTQIVGQNTVSLSRNTEINYMKIVMRGPDNAWFAFGFGSTSMANTYAIVSVNSLTTQEWILDTHNVTYPMIKPTSWVYNETDVQDGIRTVTLIRPYSTDETYDFTSFMSAETGSLGLISALGMDTVFPMIHMERGSKTITTSCSADSGDDTPSPIVAPGPDDDANMFGYSLGLVMSIIVYIML